VREATLGHKGDVTGADWLYWEAQLPSVYRTPRREIPAGLLQSGSVLQDLADGRPDITPQVLACLQGSERYKRAPLPDPSVGRLGVPPDIVLEQLEAERVEEVALAELPRRVRRWLAKLTETDATILRMRFGIGCMAVRVREIAGVLGCSPKCVYARERRAMDALSQLINEEARSGSQETPYIEELAA
jgi:hypothetical protein